MKRHYSIAGIRKLHFGISYEVTMKTINYKNVLLIMAGVIMCCMIAWFAICAEPNSIAFNNEDAHTIDGEFQVSVGKESYMVTAPAKVNAQPDDTIIITKVLDAEEIKGNSIMFYARQSFVNVYVGEEQCIKDTSDREMPYYITPGSYWHCFRLPSDWEGKELRIEIKVDVARYAGEVPTIYTGNKNAFVYMALENGMYSLVLCIPILVFGIALVAFGIFSAKKKLKSRMIILGMFAIATSVWNILEARITQVLFQDIQMATVVLFSCYYVIPFLAACYLDTYKTFHKNKFMRTIMYVTGGIYVILQALQGMNVIRYIDFVALGHIMIAVILLGVAVNYVMQRRRNKKVPDAVVYKAMMILGFFCFIDMFRYHLSPMLKATQFSMIGFLIFFFYLGFSVINQMNEAAIRERENAIYKRLAFIDKMTQIYNRTAFEQKLHTLRQAKMKEPTYFCLIDMNNLKKINDTYGHIAGDNAIMELARVIAAHFKGAECYRIGGDEFCIIAEGISEEKIKEYYKKVQDELNAKSKNLDYDIVTAMGYSRAEQGNPDECFNKADALMYENKKSLKG